MNYWIETLYEILPENGVLVRDETLRTIADDVAVAASVQSEYAAPVAKTKLERFEFEKMTCPECKGRPQDNISYTTRIRFKGGCGICKSTGSIEVVRR